METTTQETKPTEQNEPIEQPVEKRKRRVTVLPKVDLSITVDGKTTTSKVYRNPFDIIMALKDVPNNAIISCDLLEDTEHSEPDPDAKEPLRIPLVRENGLPVSEFIKRIETTIIHPNASVTEFQRLCEFMSIHAPLKCALITLVYENEGKPVASGFSYLTASSEVTDEDMIVLGEAAQSQTDLYRDKAKSFRPGLTFPSESKIILPTDPSVQSKNLQNDQIIL